MRRYLDTEAQSFLLLIHNRKSNENSKDAIFDEMTVGERYTNAGQYLIDAFPVVREALAKHGGK